MNANRGVGRVASNALELMFAMDKGESAIGLVCTCREEDGEDAPWLAECLWHGHTDCPHGDPLHYHHDGCPSCVCDEAPP